MGLRIGRHSMALNALKHKALGKLNVLGQMKLVTRVGLGFTILVVLMALTGISGSYGLRQLSAGGENLTGPVQETSNAAQDCVIEVENQMTSAARLSGGNAKQNDVLYVQNQQKVLDDHLKRMFAAGVLSDARKTELDQAKPVYDESLNGMLDSFLAFQQAKTAYQPMPDDSRT